MCVATIFVVVVVGAAKTDLTQRFSELAELYFKYRAIDKPLSLDKRIETDEIKTFLPEINTKFASIKNAEGAE